MDCMDLSLVFANTAQLDLQHCLYILCSDEVSSVDSGGYGWLFILAGVGGAGIYLASYSREDNSQDQDQQWRMRFTPLKWIFEDQERCEENSNPFFSIFLRGFHLGILSPKNRTVTKPATYSDLSLNSFSDIQHPQKFLVQPMCTKKLLNTKSKGKKFNQKNETKRKRSPFNRRMKHSEDQMILQRVVTANRLSYKFFKQEANLRMEGDGCDNPEDFYEHKNTNSEEKYLIDECPFSCSDQNYNSSYCLQKETESEEVPSWREFLHSAADLRRFIRETSFDSLASDISFGVNFHLEEEDEKDFIQSNLTDTPLPPIEENAYSKQLFNENTFWKLVDLTDEVDDDNRSFVGSILDNWEWDEECYHDEEDLTKDEGKYYLLPDTSQELDLEAELCDSKSSSPSSRCSSTCGRATPEGKEFREDEPSEGK